MRLPPRSAVLLTAFCTQLTWSYAASRVVRKNSEAVGGSSVVGVAAGSNASRLGVQWTQVRVVDFNQSVPERAALMSLKQYFEQDERPVLLRGAQKYFFPASMSEPMEFLATHCGNAKNDVPNDITTSLKGSKMWSQMRKIRMVDTIAQAGMKHLVHDQPKDYREFLTFLRGEKRNPQYEAYAADLIRPGGAYLVGIGFKLGEPKPSKGYEGCPALMAEIQKGGLLGGYMENPMLLLWGGLAGNPLASLHKHNDWPLKRRTNFEQKGRYWKSVVVGLHGRKKWAIFPPSEESKLYKDNAEHYAGAIQPYMFNAFAPATAELIKHPMARAAHGWTVDVLPGDILVLPSEHVHHIKNVEHSLAMAVDLYRDF